GERGIAIPESVHRDSAGKIEISAAVLGDEVGSLASYENGTSLPVDRQQGVSLVRRSRRHASLPLRPHRFHRLHAAACARMRVPALGSVNIPRSPILTSGTPAPAARIAARSFGIMPPLATPVRINSSSSIVDTASMVTPSRSTPG